VYFLASNFANAASTPQPGNQGMARGLGLSALRSALASSECSGRWRAKGQCYCSALMGPVPVVQRPRLMPKRLDVETDHPKIQEAGHETHHKRAARRPIAVRPERDEIRGYLCICKWKLWMPAFGVSTVPCDVCLHRARTWPWVEVKVPTKSPELQLNGGEKR